jgi:hypothetical protein
VKQLLVTNKCGRSTRTSKQGDSHGKFVAEEELKVGLSRLNVYNCSWSSLAQSFFGPSPAGLVTIIYSLIFETPPTWRARSLYLYPKVTRWSSYTPRHWVPFSSPPTTRRSTVEVFEPAFTRGTVKVKVKVILRPTDCWESRYIAAARTTQKT